MQTVKLGIIFVKLAHNKTLDLGGDSYPTHFTPSLGNPIGASDLQAGNFATFQQTVTRFGAHPQCLAHLLNVHYIRLLPQHNAVSIFNCKAHLFLRGELLFCCMTAFPSIITGNFFTVFYAIFKNNVYFSFAFALKYARM